MTVAMTPSSERGAILIHVAVGLLVLIGFTTFVVDYGVLWVGRGQAQNAADAGALAGAVALAFDNANDRTDSGPAKQSAFGMSQANFVWGDSPAVQIASDITFPACPGGTDTCVRVDVYRNQSRGNALPVIFGGLLGLTGQGIRATATAEVRPANASDCLKPWGIPDKWVENYPTPGPWTPTDKFNKYKEKGPKGVLLSNPDVYVPPTANGPGTGFTIAADDGALMVLKSGTPSDAVSPGWFFPLQLTAPGGNSYRDNIVSCANVVWGIGDSIPIEPGNKTGPTIQGVRDLIAEDPNARWDPITKTVVGSCAPTTCSSYARSPRIVLVPIFNTEQYEDGRQTGRVVINVVNILGFFIDSVQNNDVTGYLMSTAGSFSSTRGNITTASAFTQNIALVQ